MIICCSLWLPLQMEFDYSNEADIAETLPQTNNLLVKQYKKSPFCANVIRERKDLVHFSFLLYVLSFFFKLNSRSLLLWYNPVHHCYI